MKIKKYYLLVLACFVGLSIFTGCGDDDDENVNDESSDKSELYPEGWYTVKQGEIVYTLSSGENVYYSFDNYGKLEKECYEFNGNTHKAGYYNDHEAKISIFFKPNSDDSGYTLMDLPYDEDVKCPVYNFNEEMNAAISSLSTTSLTATIAGKECSGISFISDGSEATILQWEGLVFKLKLSELSDVYGDPVAISFSEELSEPIIVEGEY